MSKYFVIGDVHGKFGMLQELLKYWDGTSQLVFLGDLIDRGEDSRSVLTLVCDLVKNQIQSALQVIMNICLRLG